MNICNNNHTEICYDSYNCPMCELLADLAQLRTEYETLEKELEGCEHDLNQHWNENLNSANPAIHCTKALSMIYYVYEAKVYDSSTNIQGLVTSDHIHWWAIDSTLSEALAYLNSGAGWTQTNITWRPGTLLYTSETNPELFI